MEPGEGKEWRVGGRRAMRRRKRQEYAGQMLKERDNQLTLDSSCKTLGVDPDIFDRLVDPDQTRRFIDRMRVSWGLVYQAEGQFEDEMIEVNKAADFIIDAKGLKESPDHT